MHCSARLDRPGPVQVDQDPVLVTMSTHISFHYDVQVNSDLSHGLSTSFELKKKCSAGDRAHHHRGRDRPAAPAVLA